MRCSINCIQRASSSSTAVFNVTKRNIQSASINTENLSVFKNVSNWEWTNESSGSFKALHALNRLRVPWIISYLRKSSLTTNEVSKTLAGMNILDVGCGGGLLTNTLCRLGANVVGLDANESAICMADEVATQTLCADQRSRIHFECSAIEDYVTKHMQSFDGVIASEVIEHVSDVNTFVQNCLMLAKPQAKVFITTINKTILSRIFAIWVAENLLSLVPKGVHDWENFVEPSRLQSIFFENNCRMGPVLGMCYNPITNLWAWSNSTQVNYAVVATRN